MQTIYANDTCGLAHIAVRVPPNPNRPQPLGPANWPFGTTEPPYPAPIHPQCAPETATCSYHLTTLSDGSNYKWYVVAHMDVTASIVNPVVNPIIFTTSGSYSLFSVGAGRIPGCCR